MARRAEILERTNDEEGPIMMKMLRNWLNGWTTVDPAVALGLFGTGVGYAVPPFSAETDTRLSARFEGR